MAWILDENGDPILDEAGDPILDSEIISGLPLQLPRGHSIYLWDIPAHNGTAETTLRVSTHTFVTAPTDTPANQAYEGLLTDPGSVDHSVFDGNATSGKGNVDLGLIELANTGVLDPWIDYGWGRQAVLKTISREGEAVMGAEELLYITVIGIESADAPRSLRLRLRSRLAELQQPLLTERYLGTTNQFYADDVAEGESDLKDQLKPHSYGTTVNVKSHLVNQYALIHQFAANPQYRMRVYDGGLELPVQADYPTVLALRDAPVDAGYCVSCVAQGSAKLGAVPAFAVTADLWEDPGYQAGGTHSASQVIIRILEEFGILDDDLDLQTFSDFHDFNPAELGIYIDTDAQVLDIISNVADSVGGAIIDTTLGQFQAVWLDEPSVEVDASYTLRDLLAEGTMQLFAGPSQEGQGVPAYAINLTWGKIWQTQSAGDLAGLVSETDLARKELLAEGTRRVHVEDTAVLEKHPLAVVLDFDTLLANEADATAEAARRLALYKRRRDRLSFPVSFADDTDRGNIELGRSVKVTMNRFGYDAGKNFIVLGRKDDFKTKIRTLSLWG